VPTTTLGPVEGRSSASNRNAKVRETLRAVFDLIQLAEPAQAELWHSHALTLTQLAAIRALAGGPLPAGKLAERLATSPTSLTRVLDRLEARGLVERVKDDRDRRKVAIRLLPAGSRLLDGISVLAGTAMHEAIVAMIPAERDQLLASASLLTELTRQKAQSHADARAALADPQRVER
jgi:DNA-binding MarR family transcriptional regulator